MGQIQQAVNAVLETAATATGAVKAFKEIKAKEQPVEPSASDISKRTIERGQIQERISKLSGEIEEQQSILKEGKSDLKLARAGQEKTMLNGKEIIGTISDKQYQKDLIKRYRAENKRTAAIIEAKANQKFGYEDYLRAKELEWSGGAKNETK